MNRGQIAIAALLPVASLVAAVAAPIIYIGGIKQDNAVQAVQISTQAQEIQELKTANAMLNAKMDAILIRLGVDPTKITMKGQ